MYYFFMYPYQLYLSHLLNNYNAANTEETVTKHLFHGVFWDIYFNCTKNDAPVCA